MSALRAVAHFASERPLWWIVISIATGTICGNVAVFIGWSL